MPDAHTPDPVPPQESETRRVVVDVALNLAFLAVFAWLALMLVRPFLPLLLWTVVIAAALHPLHVRLAARTGRPVLAAILVTVGALLVTLGPIAALLFNLVVTAEWLTAQTLSGALDLPDPPERIATLPVVGKAITDNWTLATTNVEGFLDRYATLLLGAGERAARPALHFLESMLTLLAAVALSGFLHVPGPRLGEALARATERVAGARGAVFVAIAAETIRNVARSVIGVSVIQALLIGVGFIVGGVPAAGLLTLAALIFAILQIGAWIVVLPALAFAWFERGAGPAALLALYLVPAAASDLVLKPLMLSGSRTTPMLVIFAGVVGGAIAYGLIGVFIGPILLAIAYELIRFGLYGDEAPARPGGIE
jgi:predicted PurR-regulated permease PerM